MIAIFAIFCAVSFQRVHGQHFSNDLSVINVYGIEATSNCHLWFYYNTTTKRCECFPHPYNKVKLICTETDSEALLNFGYCMTYNNKDGTISIGQRASFMVHNRNVSERNYLRLPKNVSELNDYMCTPMNRKGLVCSECIDGFGPSVFSYGFQCTNCTDSWYEIPVYLLLEFVPITVFYLFILAFQISVTMAPMASFVF